MADSPAAPAGRSTRRAIVKLLKTEGPLDSARLAERLGLTAMGVRQHLYALQRETLVTAEERPGAPSTPAASPRPRRSRHDCSSWRASALKRDTWPKSCPTAAAGFSSSR